MSQERQVILIIEAKDGAKYQGNFVSKDTEKLLITLSNVTKTFEGKEETFPLKEIKKEDIAKISMIENKPKKDEVENINEIPENKKSDNNVANVEKVYDRSKDDFFDQLKPVTNSDMKSVANFYNKKNADTFKLTQNEIENDNDGNNRGKKEEEAEDSEVVLEEVIIEEIEEDMIIGINSIIIKEIIIIIVISISNIIIIIIIM